MCSVYMLCVLEAVAVVVMVLVVVVPVVVVDGVSIVLFSSFCFRN